MLLPEHLDMLHASAINDAVIEARGYQSINAADAEEYGFSYRQRLSGLLIPLWGVDGTVRGYQLRPDTPHISETTGKPIRYETPWGQTNVLDVNPLMQANMRMAKQGFWITEGSKKVDSLASHGITAIGLSGVWNWRGKNSDGGYTTLADWEDVNIKGSRFVVAYDSDIYTNPMVNSAAKRLKQFLLYRKADSVRVLELPHDGPEKIGVDDYLASIQKVV